METRDSGEDSVVWGSQTPLGGVPKPLYIQTTDPTRKLETLRVSNIPLAAARTAHFQEFT